MNEDLEAMDGLCAKIIEQRDRIEALEVALREIAGYQSSPTRRSAIKIARAALDTGKPSAVFQLEGAASVNSEAREAESDLVKRLREPVDPDDPNLWIIDANRLEAADRIEALEAELKLTKEQHNKGGEIILELAAHIEKLKEPVEWWEEQCRQHISRIEALEAALREIFSASIGKSAEIQHIARAALDKDAGK